MLSLQWYDEPEANAFNDKEYFYCMAKGLTIKSI